MKALIPALGALPWALEQGSVSTGYELPDPGGCTLPDSLPSTSLQQLRAWVIEFSTVQQQFANLIAAAAATTVVKHDTITNTSPTQLDSCQAQPCARTLARTFDARSICKFSHSHLARGYRSELDRPIRRTFIELTHAAERESTDITTPVQTSGTALALIAASSASTDARIGNANTNARG